MSDRISIAPSDQTRVLIAKPGLDDHDRGAKVVARALRDAGTEVVYSGLQQTPEQIVEMLVDAGAHVVGLTILSGPHMTLVPRILELIREQHLGEVVVMVAGTIPTEDIAELRRIGVNGVFTPGASTKAIIEFICGAIA